MNPQEREKRIQEIGGAAAASNLFMKSSEQMAVDNFLRLVKEKTLQYTMNNGGEITNLLEDKAVADSILEDPNGWACSEKFRHLVESGSGFRSD